jgi:hypothetical protein
MNKMEDFPKDGTRCLIEFQHNVVSKGWFWGKPPMGDEHCIRNDQNVMSPYLTPIQWWKE